MFGAVEVAVVEWLAEKLAAVTVVNVFCDALPPDFSHTSASVVVRRVGGAVRDLILDDALLRVEVRGDDAANLAALVRELFLSLDGSVEVIGGATGQIWLAGTCGEDRALVADPDRLAPGVLMWAGAYRLTVVGD